MRKNLLLAVLALSIFLGNITFAQNDSKESYRAGLAVFYPFSANITKHLSFGINAKLGYEYRIFSKLKIGGDFGVGFFSSKDTIGNDIILHIPLNFSLIYPLWNINPNSKLEITGGPLYHTLFSPGNKRYSSMGIHAGLRYSLNLSEFRQLQIELSGHEWIEEFWWDGTTETIEIAAVISSPSIKTMFSKEGKKEQPARVVEFVEETPREITGEKDSDGDGVPDLIDKSPGTPAGVTVDEAGRPLDDDMDGIPDYIDLGKNTPLGVDIDSRGRPLDSDGDKVPDYRDCHPATPQEVKVDKMGVPVDIDHDGVPDYKDKEMNTPANFIVDKDGIGIGGIEDGILKGVAFEGDKGTLTAGSYQALFKLFLGMYIRAEIKIRIAGYCEDLGSMEVAVEKSLRLADAVKSYLVNTGIEPDRIGIEGLGAVNFIHANVKAPENRRVEITIIK